MNVLEYTNFIKKKLNSPWIVNLDISLDNENFNLFAKCNLSLVRTMFSNNNVIDSFHTNEYIFIKHVDTLTLNIVKEFIIRMTSIHENLVFPSKDHKSSYTTAVIIYNHCSDIEALNNIKKFKYEKTYKFYLFGFSQIRLLAINLNNNSIVSNKYGKTVKKEYLPVS